MALDSDTTPFIDALILLFFAIPPDGPRPHPALRVPEQILRELTPRAAAGDEQAFSELVDLYKERVHSIAWQLSRNHEDALDITQEAFVRLWNALPAFKGTSSFSTWMHRIVLNTGIDFIRRESRHAHPSAGASTADHNFPEPPPELTTRPTQRDAIYEAQLQRIVLQALTKLSERQRNVFVLRYYHALELREIAEIIHTSEGTVKQHLARAQAQLKIQLADLKP